MPHIFQCGAVLTKDMCLVVFLISGSGYLFYHARYLMRSLYIFLHHDIRENMRLYNILCVIVLFFMVK